MSPNQPLMIWKYMVHLDLIAIGATKEKSISIARMQL
jgi:hypothetical protein